MPVATTKTQDVDAQRPRTNRHLPFYRTATVLLAAILVGVARAGATESEMQHVFPVVEGLVLVWFLLHAASWFGSYFRGRVWPSEQVSVTSDVVLSLALIACTGAVDSVFLPVLLSAILSVSVVYRLRPTLLTASASVLVLTALTLTDLGTSQQGWSTRSAPARSAMVISSLVGQGIAVHGVAFLGARLVGGLRQMAGLNERIVANIGEGIIALDGKGRMILVNSEALRILNYPETTQWLGRKPREIFRRNDDSDLREALWAPVAGEREVSWTLGRQENVPLSLRMTPIGSDRPGDSAWVAVFHDLTLRKRATAAELRVRHLEELEDLALGLVHEVRNPLASIRGSVQELGRGVLDPAQTQKLTGIVLRESDRLDRIVDEFLEYSRTSPTQQVPVDLSKCIDEVVETLGSRPDASSVQLAVDHGDDVNTVLGHPEMLFSVFVNLGINALEAMGGAGELQFRLLAGRPDGCDVIVEDNGPGMSEEVRRRIFNPFFSTKPREGGLGLALVERIVHGHGGTIDVTSNEGEGTRFRVWIPGERTDQQRENVDVVPTVEVA
ncbi:MAG: ATP-binding protein [Planctomycetota bacterium]